MRVFVAAFAAVVALAPCTSSAADSAVVLPAGASRFDVLVGRWVCKTNMMGAGPDQNTVTYTRAGSGRLRVVSVDTTSGENSGYLIYSAKTKLWSNPSAFANGGSEYQSTAGSGSAVVFDGTFADAATHATVRVRDTDVFTSRDAFTDSAEMYAGGTWVPVALGHCTRS